MPSTQNAIFIQVAILTISILSLLFLCGKIEAISATLGGAISILPNAIFSALAFRYKASESPKKMLLAFYVGEGLKLFLVAAMFLLIFLIFSEVKAVFLFGFFVLFLLINSVINYFFCKTEN